MMTCKNVRTLALLLAMALMMTSVLGCSSKKAEETTAAEITAAETTAETTAAETTAETTETETTTEAATTEEVTTAEETTAAAEETTAGDAGLEEIGDSCVDVLDYIYNQTSKEFPVYGGNFENSVDSGAGELPLTDTDSLSNMLLIPEEVQGYMTDCATVYHMMNANSFTGCALKLSNGMQASDAAAMICDAFLNNNFMCGFPEKIAIYTTSQGLIFFFGDGAFVDEFKAATEAMGIAELAVEENY